MVKGMTHPLENYLEQTRTTGRQFAAKVGVREATVSAWKSGVIPKPAQMQRIAEVTAGALPVTAWFQSDQGDAA